MLLSGFRVVRALWAGDDGVPRCRFQLLGGSWVVIRRVISKVTILITHTRGLITLLITTPEPPSRVI